MKKRHYFLIFKIIISTSIFGQDCLYYQSNEGFMIGTETFPKGIIFEFCSNTIGIAGTRYSAETRFINKSSMSYSFYAPWIGDAILLINWDSKKAMIRMKYEPDRVTFSLTEVDMKALEKRKKDELAQNKILFNKLKQDFDKSQKIVADCSTWRPCKVPLKDIVIAFKIQSSIVEQLKQYDFKPEWSNNVDPNEIIKMAYKKVYNDDIRKQLYETFDYKHVFTEIDSLALIFGSEYEYLKNGTNYIVHRDMQGYFYDKYTKVKDSEDYNKASQLLELLNDDDKKWLNSKYGFSWEMEAAELEKRRFVRDYLASHIIRSYEEVYSATDWVQVRGIVIDHFANSISINDNNITDKLKNDTLFSIPINIVLEYSRSGEWLHQVYPINMPNGISILNYNLNSALSKYQPIVFEQFIPTQDNIAASISVVNYSTTYRPKKEPKFIFSEKNPNKVVSDLLTKSFNKLSLKKGKYILETLIITSGNNDIVKIKIRDRKGNVIQDVAGKLSTFGEVGYFDAEGNATEAPTFLFMPEGITKESVLNNYFEARGGAEAFQNITSFEAEMSLEVSGNPVAVGIKTVKNIPDYYLWEQSMQGKTLMKVEYKDGAATRSGERGNAELEGEELASTAKEAKYVISQLEWLENPEAITFDGQTLVNGKDVYQITEGEQTHYFDVATGLLYMSVETAEGPEGDIAVSTVIKEWQEVGGLTFVKTIERSAGPQSFTVTVNSTTWK